MNSTHHSLCLLLILSRYYQFKNYEVVEKNSLQFEDHLTSVDQKNQSVLEKQQNQSVLAVRNKISFHNGFKVDCELFIY